MSHDHPDPRTQNRGRDGRRPWAVYDIDSTLMTVGQAVYYCVKHCPGLTLAEIVDALSDHTDAPHEQVKNGVRYALSFTLKYNTRSPHERVVGVRDGGVNRYFLKIDIDNDRSP